MEVIDGHFGDGVTYDEIKRDALRLLKKVQAYNDKQEGIEDKIELFMAYSLVKEEDITCNGVASDLFKSIVGNALS